MDSNEIVDAILTGANTQILEGEIVGVPLRGAEGISTNEVLVPSDGTRATAGGAAVLCEGDLEEVRAQAYEVGMIIMWFGLAADCPVGFKICNGTSGTPDMRNLVPIGAGSSYALSATGGGVSSTSSSSGAHTHTTNTPGHSLSVAELPAHRHRVRGVIDNNPGVQGGLLGNGFATVAAYTDDDSHGNPLVENTGSGTAHTHSNSTTDSQGSHTHTVATLPPYRALFFIMYTG